MAAEALPVQGARDLPKTIGRYDVVALLGEGGMARAFVALQRGKFAAERLVVIKQVRPEFAADADFLAMFVDEARIAIRLNHPNVVHTYEVVHDYPDYFLAMEYLEGRTLAQLLRKAGRRNFPLHLHIWILIQVLSGLQYAHELLDLDGTALGIVHRDVNPSNILVTSTGEVRLLDFGIAKAANAVSFTRQGVVKGKLGYVAPEQCLGGGSDARTDLFAVGTMLWEAIAGERRSSAESSGAALQARVTNKERAIEQVVPDVAPRLAAICRRALAHDPTERYASAAQFKADLNAYQAPAGAAQLADTMNTLFGEEFAELRHRIEAVVQEGRRKPVQHVPEAVHSRHAPVDVDSSLPELALATSQQPRVRGKRALLVLAGSLGAGAIALASVLEWSAGESSSSEAPAALSVASQTLAAPVVPAAAEAPRVSARQNVRVAIAATPKRAQLRLDGKLVPNPFVGELPLDENEHEFEARASGYESHRQRVRLSEDLELTIQLTPQRAAPRPAARPVRPAPATSPIPLAPSAASVRSAPPAADVAVSEATLQPGQEMAKPSRAARTIDEQDPYQ